MIPHRDTLLVTGSDDTEGLGAVTELAEPALQEPRNVTGQAFVFENGDWKAFVPGPGHPYRERFRLMARISAAQNYDQQKHLLDKKYDAVAPTSSSRA